MFSSLSEYFFGAATPATQEQLERQHDGKMEEEEPRKDAVGMELQEDEDDWVLVDVTNEDRVSPCFSGSCSKGKSSRSGLEESWFVTPPPCFTASGQTPEHLATSPMEDLLIEHPSMSVYVGKVKNQENRTPRRKAQRPKQVRNNQVTKRCHNLRVRQNTSRPSQRAAAVAARLGIQQSTQFSIEQVEKAKKSQQKLLNRNKLERQNKAVHQQSLGTKHRHHRNSMSRSLAFTKQPR